MNECLRRMYVSIFSGMGMPSNGLYSKLKTFKRFAMATLKIKYLKGAVTLFALCLIGTASAAPNGNGNEKENKKEVKAETEKILVNETWHYESGDPTLASSYSSQPVADCDTGEDVICEILAPADPTDGTKPLMSSQVVSDINNALSGEPETNDTVQSFRLE